MVCPSTFITRDFTKNRKNNFLRFDWFMSFYFLHLFEGRLVLDFVMGLWRNFFTVLRLNMSCNTK